MIDRTLLEQAWAAVAGSDAERADLEVTGRDGILHSALATGAMATACVGVALVSAADLMRQRAGRAPAVQVNREHVAAAVRSEQLLRVDGEPVAVGFAALSRFWRTADGWVRTHANYPWHREALLAELRTDEHGLARTLRQLPSEEIEQRVFAAGGIATMVRTPEAWRAHPQGRAVGSEPLVAHDVLPGAAPRKRAPAELPADGVRVLDLTRVIAGPVGTRMLGAMGADVLRLDPVGHDDVTPGAYSDTLLGKRSAPLDLAARHGERTLHELLDEADVLVLGYRGGALDRYGLTDAELAERHPGLVIVRLTAWGHTGPWAQRRGFDSVVQAGIGIALAESTATDTPGALPCQLLDHGTGYLVAAAALDGLARQHRDGGTHVRRLSLARTGAWLLDTARPERVVTAAEHDWTVDVGPVTAVAPPGAVGGTQLRWPRASRYLADAPAWT